MSIRCIVVGTTYTVYVYTESASCRYMIIIHVPYVQVCASVSFKCIACAMVYKECFYFEL